jgi:hypothetical protein
VSAAQAEAGPAYLPAQRVRIGVPPGRARDDLSAACAWSPGALQFNVLAGREAQQVRETADGDDDGDDHCQFHDDLSEQQHVDLPLKPRRVARSMQEDRTPGRLKAP